jgi:hypothetical protein
MIDRENFNFKENENEYQNEIEIVLKEKEADSVQTILFYKENQNQNQYDNFNNNDNNRDRQNNYYFLTGGWDGIFRIFQFFNNNKEINVIEIHKINLIFPIMSLYLKKNTSIIFIGNIMGEVFSYNFSTSKIIHLLDLDSSVIEIFEFSYIVNLPNGDNIENTRLVTVEYDGKIQIFEYTTENEVCNLEFFYKSEIGLFSAALNYPILSAGLSNGNMIYFDLSKCYDYRGNKNIPQLEPEEIIKTELKGVLHLICSLNNRRGIAVCNLESKVFVCPIEQPLENNNFNNPNYENSNINETDCFNFSVHREYKLDSNNNYTYDNMIVNQVNSLKNVEIYDSFATCGSEGNLSLWNDKIKDRTFSYTNKYKYPITAFNFSDDGDYCVMALGNDYKQGCHFANINPILILRGFSKEEKNIMNKNKK